MSADNACRLLFVYGTLRHDSGHPMARSLASATRFLGRASVAGRLYDLGPYPGMTTAEPPDRAWGHLLEMHNPLATLEQLDAYEGCPCGEPIPALFQRRLMRVVAESGQTLTAWVYTYHGEVNEKNRLASGEYLPGSSEAAVL
jgi:gamma-glutamylcyclotransferase (GGCT)/AIG2-like uncharacterized protein YtfP